LKIIALWDRQKVAPNSRSIFALLADGQLLYISPEEKYLGTDADGNRKYEDTGRIEISNAFNKEDRFTFKKANYFMVNFGGRLIWKNY